MKTFSELKTFAERMIRLTEQSGYSYEIYMCSAKIGKVIKVNEFGHFNMQTKYLVLYTRDARDEVGIILDGFAPRLGYQPNKDLRSKGNRYGIDLYTNVESIHPLMEPQLSSLTYSENDLKQELPKWLRQQNQQLVAKHPNSSEEDISNMMSVIRMHFKQVVQYLRSRDELDPRIRIRRSSGVKHTINVKPNTESRRTTYSNLLIAISSEATLPKIITKQTSKSGKVRAGSITARYQNDPNVFNYYDKFGIFEVLDEKVSK